MCASLGLIIIPWCSIHDDDGDHDDDDDDDDDDGCLGCGLFYNFSTNVDTNGDAV